MELRENPNPMARLPVSTYVLPSVPIITARKSSKSSQCAIRRRRSRFSVRVIVALDASEAADVKRVPKSDKAPPKRRIVGQSPSSSSSSSSQSSSQRSKLSKPLPSSSSHPSLLATPSSSSISIKADAIGAAKRARKVRHADDIGPTPKREAKIVIEDTRGEETELDSDICTDSEIHADPGSLSDDGAWGKLGEQDLLTSASSTPELIYVTPDDDDEHSGRKVSMSSKMSRKDLGVDVLPVLRDERFRQKAGRSSPNPPLSGSSKLTGGMVSSSSSPVSSRKLRKSKVLEDDLSSLSSAEESTAMPESKKESSSSSSIATKARRRRPSPTQPSDTSSVTKLGTTAESAQEDVDVTAKKKKKKLKTMFQIGDLVVHKRFGVGRFEGVELSDNGVSQQDFAAITYSDGDLLVPMNQIELLSSYVGPVEKNTKLDFISSAKKVDERKHHREVSRARRTVRQGMKQQILNLHSLYSLRAKQKREPHPGDAELEEKFHSLFPFQLTEDQESAIDDVYNDMSEQETPMDRLLCGDVGFGKTEVAMRAIFRALCSGKQVGVLAPTTILAHQHYQTISQRLKDFPEFQVGRLTRFVKMAEQQTTLSGLENGDVHVLVGTHAVIGDRVSFKNLGLVIVDEEHRFGVNQKERLRSIYPGADVLTLSATPIPRTLHISMSGLRDVSVIRTPPKTRKPVITKAINSRDTEALRAAIQLELDRGGQCFYVVPRVHSMEASENRLLKLFPFLRIITAHADMRDLEDRVHSFAVGDADLLLCTTIIENGIDLPRVNTMIVENAIQFGLAQLHQLRGRVGRGDQQAYAYLISDEGSTSSRGTMRIRALEELSALGSGFALASKDMELRGFGNVLGVEQSGRLGGLEPEEYSQMMFEELELSRDLDVGPLGSTLPVVRLTQVMLPVSAYVPSEYVGSKSDRKMMVYAALANVQSEAELQRVAQLLEAKYGPLPGPMQQFMMVSELKLYGKILGIHRIYAEREHVVLEWGVDHEIFDGFVELLPSHHDRRRFLHIVSDERVQVRGLALLESEVVLRKLRDWLKTFSTLGEELRNAREAKLRSVRKNKPGSARLVDELRDSKN